MLCFFSPGFNVDFLSLVTSQEIGWEQRLQFSVEWDIKLQLN